MDFLKEHTLKLSLYVLLFSALAASVGCKHAEPQHITGQRALTGPACASGLADPSDDFLQMVVTESKAADGAEEQFTALEKSTSEKLRDQICQGSKRCEAVGEKISTTRHQTETQICVLATLTQADYAQLSRASTSRFDDRLEDLIEELSKEHLSGMKSVVVPEVWDVGTPGSRRGLFFSQRLHRALDARGVSVASGYGPDNGSSHWLELTVQPTVGRPDLLDVILTVRTATGERVFQSAPIEVSAMVTGPAVPDSARTEPLQIGSAAGVHLELTGRDASGAFCPGGVGSLTLHAAEPVFARVFMMYGEGKTRLIWPGDRSDDRQLRPGEHIELGHVQAGTSSERSSRRFYVVASDTLEGLGQLAQLQARCEFSEREAKSMYKGLGFPPTSTDRARGTGYRVQSTAICSGPATSGARDIADLEVLDACFASD